MELSSGRRGPTRTRAPAIARRRSANSTSCTPRTRPARRRRRRWPTSPPHGVPCVAGCRARCSTSWRGAASAHRRPSCCATPTRRCSACTGTAAGRSGARCACESESARTLTWASSRSRRAPRGARAAAERTARVRRGRAANGARRGRRLLRLDAHVALGRRGRVRAAPRRAAGRTSHRDFRRPTFCGRRPTRTRRTASCCTCARVAGGSRRASSAWFWARGRRGRSRRPRERTLSRLRLVYVSRSARFRPPPARRATDRSTARPYTRPRPTAIQCTLRWCRAPRPPGT